MAVTNTYGKKMALQKNPANIPPHLLEIPGYARNFRNQDIEEQTKFFVEHDIKSSIDKKLFEFLCIVIEDALKKTHRALTTYKYYFDIVLKWASNPNNLRLIPGFPRGEETLKNNFDPLLKRLNKQGLVIVNPDMEAEDFKKTIAFTLEQNIQSSETVKELTAIKKFLNTEFEKSIKDLNHMLPTRKQIETAIKRKINPQIRTISLAPEKFNKNEISKEEYSKTDIIELDFKNDYIVLIPPGRLSDLRNMATARMIAALKKLINYPDLITFFKEKVAGKSSITLKGLLDEYEGSGFKSNMASWIMVTHKLLEIIKNIEKPGSIRINKRQAIYLMHIYLTNERKEEYESGIEDNLIRDINHHLSEHQRYMTREELVSRPQAQNYINRYSEEQFNSLFSKFISDHSLQNTKDPEQSIIELSGKQIGTYYIHASNIMGIFRSLPEKLKKLMDQIIEKYFIIPLGDNLYRSDFDSSLLDSISSEEKIKAKIEETVDNYYKQHVDIHTFLDIHSYFSRHITQLSILCEEYNIPEKRFVLSDKQGESFIKPVLMFLGINKAEILKRANGRVPIMRKFWYKIMAMFKGDSQPTAARTNKKTAKRKTSKKSTAARRKKGSTSSSGSTKQAATPAVSKKPKNAVTVTPETLYVKFSKGKTRDYYLGIWNRHLGQAGEYNKKLVHEIIQEKLNGLARKFKSGTTAVNLEEQISYIAFNPRLSEFPKKEALSKYVGIIMLEKLEEFRKKNRIRLEYYSTKK